MSEREDTFTPEIIKTALEINEPEWPLAHLLLNDVVFVNTHWSEKEWPEEAREGVVIVVNCNDWFGPYADCERIKLSEIETLYRLWLWEPSYAQVAWVMAKRKQPAWSHREQKYGVKQRMIDLGWNYDALVRGELPTPSPIETRSSSEAP